VRFFRLRNVAIILSLLLHFVLGAGAARVGEQRRARRRATAVAVVEKKKEQKKKQEEKPKDKLPEPPKKIAAIEKPKAPPAAKIPEAPKPVDEPPKQVASVEPKDIGAYDPNSTVQAPDQHHDEKPPEPKAVEPPKPKAVEPPKPKNDTPKKDPNEGGGEQPCTEAPSKPEPVAKTEIEYTDQARQDGVEGRLVLEVTVDENGAVTDVSVVNSVDAALDAAAIAAVKQWRFKPAMACGKPVKGGKYRLARRFELGD
jgi:protein TonB